MLRRLRTAGLLVALVLAATAPAAVAIGPRPVTPIALNGLPARHAINDVTLRHPPARATAAAAYTQLFDDGQGRTITVTTDIPGLDLTPYASILAATVHGDEIRDVLLEVVRSDQIATICGDPQAASCYLPDDPTRNGRGHIWIPQESPELPHLVVHEYGHHMDNQLLNLAHLGGCGFDNDGSRNWFFERDVADNILGSGFDCAPSTGWDHLLGELYAEDFVSLNGFSGWVLASAPPPTELVLSAMAYDIAYPFSPHTLRWATWVGTHGRNRRITLRN